MWQKVNQLRSNVTCELVVNYTAVFRHDARVGVVVQHRTDDRQAIMATTHKWNRDTAERGNRTANGRQALGRRDEVH